MQVKKGITPQKLIYLSIPVNYVGQDVAGAYLAVKNRRNLIDAAIAANRKLVAWKNGLVAKILLMPKAVLCDTNVVKWMQVINDL